MGTTRARPGHAGRGPLAGCSAPRADRRGGRSGAPSGGSGRGAASAGGRPRVAPPGASRCAGSVPDRGREEAAAMSMRRLSQPRPTDVDAGSDGLPTAVCRTAISAIAEDWVVEDRWWTGKPLRRRYFELVLAEGRNVVVFRDLHGGGWFEQRS